MACTIMKTTQDKNHHPIADINNDDEIFKEDFQKTIRYLENRKATELDGIFNEVLKYGGQTLEEQLI